MANKTLGGGGGWGGNDVTAIDYSFAAIGIILEFVRDRN